MSETSIDADLARMFAHGGCPKALVVQLQGRAQQFRQALARGGNREDFALWQASLDALEIVLSLPQAAGNGNAPEPLVPVPNPNPKEPFHVRYQL